jgi:hypothetical protein
VSDLTQCHRIAVAKADFSTTQTGCGLLTFLPRR